MKNESIYTRGCHWITDATLTLEEEQEQLFSKISRYGSVTKHMGIASH
jgi:hypothetical protein